ncbi:DNA-binding transcriptional regulator, XRE-family HTH domain [Anaerovibrio lipolyticus DSM 3074]|uniref:DNA-binding transcriptional regulator, XRE-family HTH domain n=1 Tax=Anaerovibrio lipolyticus DSM 3074 TaxID=1120997 RepID=A0A1M6C4V7_9FIRM|nr:helix-turn-helix transcriptional regulator [Anaerovibrio lipolyticus]SHI55973.1 DNA-binding transcriptional regulator, XRE-family HTH domain [Anaerovibrio lipolyticus DSM 3074]
MTVNEKIRVYLKEHGIMQTAVARATGINIKTFNYLINGKSEMSVDRMVAICKFLNVPVSFFLDDESKNLTTNG